MPVDLITGPFCIEITNAYIAHETDAPGSEVPILLEDESGPLLPESAASGLYGVVCGEGQEVCCNTPTTFKFISSARTEIVYGPSLRTKHGTWPHVYVYYYQPDEDGEIIIMGVFTRVSMVGSPPTKIIVDHGGVATGIIKIV